MEASIREGERCWAVLFGLDESRVIRARSIDEVYSKPEALYKISFIDLKYRFLDIDKETDKMVETVRRGPDPRLFYGADASAKKIVALPECKNKNVNKALLEMQLDLYKYYPEHIKQRHIREYDLGQRDPTALRDEIRSAIVEHANSAVLQLDGIKPADFVSAPTRSLSMKGVKAFPNLEIAINEIYASWSALPWEQVKAVGAGYDWEAYQGVLKALQGFFDSGIEKGGHYAIN